MPQIETTFVDITSIVPASWFNTLQKHLAGFMNLKVTITGDAVEVVAASHGGVASVYIGGEMRRNDTTVNFTFVAEAVDTWSVFAVATAAVDTFAVEVAQGVGGTPATSPYRKIAEIEWDGADITELRGVRARVIDHDHDGYGQPQIEHNDLLALTTGDPHTQYSLPDGTRAFTGEVGGVTPTAAAELATKAYADSVLLEVPAAGIFWWPSADAAPTGFLLAQGQAVSRTTYDQLFAIIGTTYGTGDGSTTFNLPDLRGRMVAGAQTQASLGDTEGSIDHTHTQTTHTHTQNAHTHTAPTHTHTGASTGSGGSHTHSQGVTGSSGGHTHTAAAHTHNDGSLAVAAHGAAIVGSRHGSSASNGLFAESDLDNSSSSTSHSHGDGSYITADPTYFIVGTSSSASKSHTHPPAGNAYAHTHPSGAFSGSTASGGASATSSESAHTHTNPSTASGGSHTHASGGGTGATAAAALSDGAVATGSGGDDVTGSATFPYLTMNAIIRYE